MHANNELGTVQPLEEIGRIAAQNDIFFHTDAVQSAGKIPLDVNALGVDLLAISGHKFYAPKGIGALYIRGGTRLRQLLYGGHHQRGFRPGTENVPGIVGLGKAAEIAQNSLAEDALRVSALRDELERELLSTHSASTRQRQRRPAHSKHHQHHFSGNRRRSSDHRSRSEGTSLLHRSRLLVRSRRTLSRPHRHRPQRRKKPAPPSASAWAATPLQPKSPPPSKSSPPP